MKHERQDLWSLQLAANEEFHRVLGGTQNAALDAALGWASPDAIWTRIQGPVESDGMQDEVVSQLGKD